MTEDMAYAERLQRLSGARWKGWLDVQAPYRWNVRRLCPGQVLDVGCGIGRNLAHLTGRGIGVDHNPTSVSVARRLGLRAYTPEQFLTSPDAVAGAYDSLLVAHVLEHLHNEEADELLGQYLPFLRPGGRVVMITPQERGWRSDPTHVRRVGPRALSETARRLGLVEPVLASFPLPRFAGRLFTYNEFVAVATTPTGHPT